MSPNLPNYGDIRLESSLGEKLHLHSMSGREELGRPFEFSLQLYSPDEAIKLADLLGSTVAVKLPLEYGKERWFHGHVVSFSDAGARDGYYHYAAQVRPWLWLMSYNSNSRIFQEQSVLEIAKEIFKERGFSDYRFSLSQDHYRKYEYAVQYRESDFKFLSRLFEQEGIYYFFEHEKDKHTLVLADSPDSHTKEQDVGEVEYRPWSKGQAVGRPHFHHWQFGLQVTPGAYVVDDYDFERPRASLVSALSSPHPHRHAQSEVYDFPGEFTKSEEGEALVKVRLQALHSQYERAWARCNVRELGVGKTFSLGAHPRADQNKDYLVLSSEYEISAGSAEAGSAVYQCSVEVCKRDIPYRSAPSTTRPLISGYQTAKVVGRSGDEIYTDKYGRVKVQFPWDRKGESNEKSSCWIRVAQMWAGAGMGSMHVPRVGQEVLVSFLEGDPDRPLVVGRVYNGSCMPPFELPAKGMVSGVKSESTPGGGGYNEISLDDTKGSEKIVVHGQFDMESTVEHDKSLIVGNNRTSSVGVDDAETIGANQTISIGANQSLTVGAASTETVTLTKALSIGAAYQVSVGTDMNETVGGLKAEEVGGAKSLLVGAASTEHVKGSKTVKSDKNISEEATENIIVKAGKQMSLHAGADFAIHGKTKGVIELAEELTIKVGSATITLKKSGDIVINGKKISVSGSGDVVVKGKKVAQN